MQNYDVEDEEGVLGAFIKKDYKKLKSFFNEFKDSIISDNALLRENIKQMRLRYVKQPLSQYLNFESYSYKILSKYGQEIRVSENTMVCEFGDFVAFDNKCICFLDFNDKAELSSVNVLKNNKGTATFINALIEWYDDNFKQSVSAENYFTLDSLIDL